MFLYFSTRKSLREWQRTLVKRVPQLWKGNPSKHSINEKFNLRILTHSLLCYKYLEIKQLIQAQLKRIYHRSSSLAKATKKLKKQYRSLLLWYRIKTYSLLSEWPLQPGLGPRQDQLFELVDLFIVRPGFVSPGIHLCTVHQVSAMRLHLHQPQGPALFPHLLPVLSRKSSGSQGKDLLSPVPCWHPPGILRGRGSPLRFWSDRPDRDRHFRHDGFPVDVLHQLQEQGVERSCQVSDLRKLPLPELRHGPSGKIFQILTVGCLLSSVACWCDC